MHLGSSHCVAHSMDGLMIMSCLPIFLRTDVIMERVEQFKVNVGIVDKMMRGDLPFDGKFVSGYIFHLKQLFEVLHEDKCVKEMLLLVMGKHIMDVVAWSDKQSVW